MGRGQSQVIFRNSSVIMRNQTENQFAIVVRLGLSCGGDPKPLHSVSEGIFSHLEESRGAALVELKFLECTK